MPLNPSAISCSHAVITDLVNDTSAGFAGAADEAEESVGSSSRPSDTSRRTEDADSMAVLAAEVAITFLFKVQMPTGLKELSCLLPLFAKDVNLAVLKHALSSLCSRDCSAICNLFICMQ